MRPVRWTSAAVLVTLALGNMLSAASKPHIVTFGKWTTIVVLTGPGDDQPLPLKTRPLFVDGRLKEYTLGAPHEVTERLFVVQRVIRVNDTLPSDAGVVLQWIWQRGGWLIVDRVTGRISPASLPQFDPDLSLPSWYRDYVAYCGVSADGKKISATVMQLGRRKPVLEKPMGEASGDLSSSPCAAPLWQRRPPRVTFAAQDDKRFTYTVHGRAVELVTDDGEESGTE